MFESEFEMKTYQLFSMLCLYLSANLIGLNASNAYAEERLCPDGKRSYFGVCPDEGNNSRPMQSEPPAPKLPAPTPRPGSAPTLIPDSQHNKPASEWLNFPLFGSDNRVASLRKVSISEVGPGGWSVFISNQFGFRCDIEFDSNGNPAILKNCKSIGSPDWIANPSVITMTCNSSAKERKCSGKYVLGTKENPNLWGEDYLTIAYKR